MRVLTENTKCIIIIKNKIILWAFFTKIVMILFWKKLPDEKI